MKLLKLIAFVFVAIVALTVFGKVKQKLAAKNPQVAQAGNPKDPGLSPQGFFLMTRAEEKKRTVTVFSAPGCPSSEAQRARDLMASIQAAGIPCEEKQGIELTFTDPDDTARMQKYGSTIENPLVMVRGWGKGNPSAEQVIAEYRSKN
jgi:hypothetical protein